MYITSLSSENVRAIEQAARLLTEEFAPYAWSTPDDAMAEVQEALEAEHICRVAFDEQGNVLGWIAGSPQYRGRVWEIDVLVVARHTQGTGIGRALLQDFEEQVKGQGGLTIILGSDDERGQTSLAGANLFVDPWRHMQTIQNPGRHPYAFYQKCGYVIVGIVPDANGLGKPDILLAKSLVRPDGGA